MGLKGPKRNPGIKTRNKKIHRHYLQALSLCHIPRCQLVGYVAKVLGLPVTTVQEVISMRFDLVGCYNG